MPLHGAVLYGGLEITKCLIKECFAHLNVKNSSGETPLDLTKAYKASKDVIDYLKSLDHSNPSKVPALQKAPEPQKENLKALV